MDLGGLQMLFKHCVHLQDLNLGDIHIHLSSPTDTDNVPTQQLPVSCIKGRSDLTQTREMACHC